MIEAIAIIVGGVILAFIIAIGILINQSILLGKETAKKLIELRNYVFKIDIPKEIQDYLQKDEALAIVYSIISLRGEFMYNLARTMAEKPPQIGWYFENERKTLTERLCKSWPDKKQSEVEELVNEFYKPKQ
jgi:hypothetical protein